MLTTGENDAIKSLRSSTIVAKLKAIESKMSPSASSLLCSEVPECKFVVDDKEISSQELPAMGMQMIAELSAIHARLQALGELSYALEGTTGVERSHKKKVDTSDERERDRKTHTFLHQAMTEALQVPGFAQVLGS